MAAPFPCSHYHFLYLLSSSHIPLNTPLFTLSRAGESPSQEYCPIRLTAGELIAQTGEYVGIDWNKVGVSVKSRCTVQGSVVPRLLGLTPQNVVGAWLICC